MRPAVLDRLPGGRRFGGTLRSLAVARRFWPQVDAHRRDLVVVCVASLAMAALELLKPWPLQFIVDHALAPKSPSRWSWNTVVWGGMAAALVVAVAAAAVAWFRELRLATVAHQVTRSLRQSIFEQLVRLSPRFHARHKSGDLLVRLMGDAPLLQGMLVESSIELMTRGLLIGGTLAILLWIDWVLAVTILAVVPVLLLMVRVTSRRIHASVRRARRKEGDMADFLHEAVAGSAVLQSLGRADDTAHRFARSARTTMRAGLKSTRLAAGLGLRVEATLGVVLAVSLGVGAFRVANGHLQLGELLVFMSYVRGTLKPMRAASKHGERVGKGTACGERILQILDSDIDVTSRPGAPAAPEAPETLSLEDVRFGYEPGKPALDGLSVTFRRGELTGLFGASGAGKSTTAALALRLYDPDAGRVTLDGIDVREMDVATLRTRFGLCMQDTVLFGETLRENLLLGRTDATDDELWAALRDAGAEDFVRAMPGGLDARLGSSGTGLSGGQRRRLSLARTLLRRSPVLIVDEPFAGLDVAAALAVRDSLRREARKAIVIVITHDVEHLDAFDRIVYLHAGRVVDGGSHAALLERRADYRQAVGASPGHRP